MNKEGELRKIAEEVKVCQKCALYKNATHSVPGEGSASAEIFFVGEAPGQVEDRMGRPFVGPSGKLLDKLIASIGLAREEVFIGNAIKHRPPGNRDPDPSEIETCKNYLWRQIEIIKPAIIATISRFAMNLFLPRAKISRDHGIARMVEGRIIFPLYHPAAALRAGRVMQDLQTDFFKLKEVLEKVRKGSTQTQIAERQEREEQMKLL